MLILQYVCARACVCVCVWMRACLCALVVHAWMHVYMYAYTGYILYTDDLLSANSLVIFFTRPIVCLLQANNLYYSLATPGVDFTAVQGANLTIPNGVSSFGLPVYILNPGIPELTEKFLVRLLSVQLVNGDIGNPNFLPMLGSPTLATIYIAENHDPNGVFNIYSTDPGSQVRGQLVLVSPKPNYSVQLVILRNGESKGNYIFIYKIFLYY